MFWKKLIVLVLSVATFCVSAQEKFVTIAGKITDTHTGRGIPFANIYLTSRASGTATNSAGEFIFKFSEAGVKDTLVVTCIGYKPFRQPLQSVGGKDIAIALEPAVVELAGITVKARTGLDILKEAIEKIPENYDTSDVQYTAFYRENVWLADFEVTLAEVVVDIYRPFKTDKKGNDQIRVLKGRKKKIDYGRDGQLYYWISGASNGVRGSLSEDWVKYHRGKYSPLNPANYRYYEYEHTETIREGQRSLIVLDIVPKKNARKGYIRTKVFLDEESLAIVRCNFELTEKGIRFTSRKDKGVAHMIMSALVHANTEYHKFQYVVSYSYHNNKWYLNRVTRHWELLLDSKKRNWEDRLWRIDMDLVMTDIKTEDVKPITEGDISKEQRPIHSMIGSDFDEAFWENYNVLKPESTDSLRGSDIQLTVTRQDTVLAVPPKRNTASNRQNGFTRADTLRGKLTPLRSCYDVTFYHLDVDIDMDKRSVNGNNLIRFVSKQHFKRMQIDLFANMKIDKIVFEGKELPYSREFNAVFVDFPEVIKTGTVSEIKVYYEGVPKEPDWDIPMNGGVLWDKDSLDNAWAQVVSQGLGASLWWPNKDHQSDEPDSMKIWITVPAVFTEISNGRLQRKTSLPGDRMRYEWYVSYPINNYDVTFNIGMYTHFEDRYISGDTLTIDYYVMTYNLKKAQRMFRQVQPMLRTFEKNFGKYPFARDGFTLLESLYPMEHQSGVCIGRINQQHSGDTSPLLWHESAHEWWGNAITSKDIADMWIHEGFATYAEILVAEDWFGKDAAANFLDDQVNAVVGEEPVIGVYDVNHIHYEIGDMYSKGSLLLHTFRSVLNNDTLWVNLLHDIQKTFRYKTLTSNELVAFISARTKTDYAYLFDQYLHYRNIPALVVVLEEKGADLQVKYRWQADVKDFRMPVKVTMTAEKLNFIYPTDQWKTMLLKNISMDAFDVDTDNFYIDVRVD